MKSLYNYFIAISLASFIAASCSDSKDEPAPMADPSTYIVFSTPTLNLNATVNNFASRSALTPSRAMATEVGDFRVWGFCTGRTPNNNSQDKATAELDWNKKSGSFKNGADLQNLNGVNVNSADGTYHNNVLTEWTNGGYHSFIGVSEGVNPPKADYEMINAGNEIVYNSTTTKVFKGPSLKITIPEPASGGLNYQNQPDVMLAASFDCTSGRVPMSFMHLMTGIRFRFNNHADQDLIITGVTYSGDFFSTGYVDLTTTSPEIWVDDRETYKATFNLINPAVESTYSQTISKGTSDLMIGPDGKQVVLLLLPNPEGTTKDDGLYVLGKNKVITIHYRLAGDSADRVFTLGDSKLILSYLPKPNTLHTASFHFTGDAFTMVFQDDSSLQWQNGTDNDNVDIIIK